MVRLIASTFVAVFILLVVAETLVAVAHEKRTAAPTSGSPPDVASSSAIAARAGQTQPNEIAFDRDSSAQFHTSALINGQDTSFLVDTGADTVALTVEDAQRLGFDVGPGDFQPIMQTASGTGNGAVLTIDRLEIGGREFHDVRAVVAEGLRENLLGRSVLRRLGRVELDGDRMIVRQN